MLKRWRVLLLLTPVLFAVAGPSTWAGSGNYSYSGYESTGGRKSSLSFAIAADGHVKGTMSVSKICTQTVKMSGSELTFTGSLTNSYPEVAGSFQGTNTHCNGNSSKTSGSIEIGYHQQFGVWVRLDGTHDWYHPTKSNPFK